MIEFLKRLLEAIPIFNQWFRKGAFEKREKEQESSREELEEFKKGGRPKW